MKPESLASLQARFVELLKSHPAPEEREVSEIGVSARSPGSRADRFEVYHAAYRLRLIESLEEDFPRLRRRLGAELFHALCERFVRLGPSCHASLAELSGDFPDFLRAQAECDEACAELAQLEWLKLVCRQLPDEEPFDFTRISEAPAGGLTLRLRWVTSVILFESAHSLHRLGPLRRGRRARVFLIRRKGLTPRVSRLGRTQALLARWLAEGITIGELAARMQSEDVSAQVVSESLKRWSAQGLLTTGNPAESER